MPGFLLHVGATGLVGQLVLARLLEAPRVARVIAPTRRALAIEHPRLHNPVVDFEALPDDAGWWAVDAVVCKWFAWSAEYPDTEVWANPERKRGGEDADDKVREVAGTSCRLPSGPLRELGEFEIAIQVHGDVTAMVMVAVIPE